MRYVFGIALVLWVSSCSAYEAKPIAAPSIEALPFSRTQATVTVAGDPYLDRVRSETFFGQDLSKLGVIPIQLFVQNHGEGQVWLQPSSISLNLPDGTSLKPVRAMVVGAMKIPRDLSGGEVAGLALGGVVGAFGGNPFVGLELGGRIMEGKERDKVFQRIADYWTKELKDVIVGKNESAHGFVFFVPNWGRAAFDEATLVYNLLDIGEAKRFAVLLPLTGLRYSSSSKDP
ncbi:MAG: hypothetical protein Q8S00_26340 [Deltaproteobacteria bacterium]|nr:hypothetical protein [Deltaproteobacteria bacterium]MDZ4347462.1 hypothetical protein [Candidatus Binatia bacterium]